ncbi:phage/plasmid primase, P4 family [Sphingomonas sp. KR1UV-12]|uniref:Phage/plasmid primase, P4 family n=1 Tax=Sphingomonas aurea TaxID=3063994 RepID=A0ABT9EHD7_9SPHN|nr:phage/plasmid primase, P4 family [Sphingomonas sp. KR1UV-12]MDP1026380.1 phage/plasmid primase, P4 family [Sphingomonas sp. KR1UV-12]
MTVTTTSSSLLEAALDYARRGWPVFPCSPRNKRPLLACDKDDQGKDIKGTGGVTKATTDEDQIRAWWRKWPRAMIGVSVGRADMLVVDFDPRREEQVDETTGEVTVVEWTLDQLKADTEAQIGCTLATSLAVRTPSGGVHIYYRMPDGEPIGNKGSLPRHVDVRGLGGYTILPPSVCEGDGKNAAGSYRWLRGDSEAAVAEMPAALVEALRTRTRPTASPPPAASPGMDRQAFPVDLDDAHRRYALRALDEELRDLEATPIGGGRYGGRNAGIYHAAMKLGGFVLAGALHEGVVRASLEAVVRAMPQNDDLPGALKAIHNGFANAKPRDLSAVGARTARGRDSGRSASSFDDAPPMPPPDAYADERNDGYPAPHDDDGEQTSFHSEASSPVASAEGSGDRIAPPRNDALDRKCAVCRTTDLGNGERFRIRHAWRFRFCNELGWFVWDGRRWELLSEEKDKIPGKVSLAVFDTVRAIGNEADLVEASGRREDLADDATDDERASTLDFIVRWKGSGDNKVAVYYSDTLRDHAKSSEGAQRLSCIAGIVKSFDDVAIRADAMDADRMAINVLNGTLRLTQKGKRWTMVEGVLKEISMGDRWGLRLDPHRPSDLISKVAGVVFDPKANSAVYDAFLAVVQPDDKMRRFLHQWGGLSLTGDISEQKLAFFHGKGRNGKSTLVDAWSHVAGDYGGSVAIETFLDQGRGRKGGEATPDLARLPGIRFLRTSEPEKGAKLAEALIKLITGGELIDARFLNKGFFSFLPSFKVTISGNHKPKITGHDDGIWRRVMLVPWDVQIAREDVDKSLPDKLKTEASGILNRLIEGLLDWRENGLTEPESVIAATAKYREQSDQLGRFLDECTRPVAGARSKSSVLFALFTAWSKATGSAEWQTQGFSKAMEDRGFEKKTSNGIHWLDIEMTKTVEDYADSGTAGEAYQDGDPGPSWGDDDPI